MEGKKRGWIMGFWGMALYLHGREYSWIPNPVGSPVEKLPCPHWWESPRDLPIPQGSRTLGSGCHWGLDHSPVPVPCPALCGLMEGAAGGAVPTGASRGPGPGSLIAGESVLKSWAAQQREDKWEPCKPFRTGHIRPQNGPGLLLGRHMCFVTLHHAIFIYFETGQKLDFPLGNTNSFLKYCLFCLFVYFEWAL